MKKIFLVLTTLITFALNAQQPAYPFYVDSLQTNWVNNTYNQMSLEEKVGQLFIVAAYSNKNSQHESFIQNLVENEHIGGLIFMQDNAAKQAQLTNQYQSKAKIPLLIGMDAEWGLDMRLKQTHRYPWAMTMGAITNNDLIYQTGQAIAQHASRLGVLFNFAPVVDVNTNPNNPIIGNRSFGSDVENVSQKGIAYARGMQDMGVLASAKHFPGHGDTSQDSHKTLPTVAHGLSRLQQVELAPFKQLIDAGVASIMVAHLNVPALEPNPKIPSSLSKKIVTDLLKNKMGFNGLIVTDALNMAGVAKLYAPGEVDLKAFEAGNDILLFSQAVKTGKQKIIAAYQNGSISEERLSESVKKILAAKYFVGLHQFTPIDTNDLYDDLNDANAKALNHALLENAITVVKNQAILPIQNLNQKIAYVALEEEDNDTFYTYLQKYTKVDKISVSNASQASKLNAYDLVIIGVHKSNTTPYKSYKISTGSQQIIKTISSQKPTIVSVFASPYALKTLDTTNPKSIIVAYQNNQEAQQIVPQIIFGAIDAKGILPVDVNQEYKAGGGIKIPNINRLSYGLPESVGLDSKTLTQIDQLAQRTINEKMAPGLQIIAARNGRVVYDKSFGYHTYNQKKKVNWNHLYDIASVTKITATLPLIMKKVGQGKLNIDQTLGSILPATKGTNKQNIVLRDMLAHKAGLPAWIGFYKETVNTKNARLYLDYYSRKKDADFNVKVDDNIFIVNSIKDSIYNQIYQSKLESKQYLYSDLGYYLLMEYLHQQDNTPINQTADSLFYKPLGMNYTTYNPSNQFDLELIIPTEKDDYFRNQLIHGYVHDQGAAMLGGVAGHAGLFSNANDLAKIMQMYLNRGHYGGTKYLDSEVVDEFTRYQFKQEKNRRGLGFDKQQLSKSGPTCFCTSDLSFGHTGFTGTMVWADPVEGLVYVFLSNRVHPSADNRKLIKSGIRSKIQGVLYDAINRDNDSFITKN